MQTPFDVANAVIQRLEAFRNSLLKTIKLQKSV